MLEVRFFVEDRKEIEMIYQILKVRHFFVRRKRLARPYEVAFFYAPEKKGIQFNAHKLLGREGVPEVVQASPFLVSVGRNWNERGLINVVEGYVRFFKRGLPFFCFDRITEEEVLSIIKSSVPLPWGGFPKERENQKALVEWMKLAFNAVETRKKNVKII